MEALYFGPPSRRLFGVLDAPARNARIGVLFCPPFGDEMASTYAALARWGKQLAKAGAAVLRFHPYGTGESDGTFTDFNLLGAISDISVAANFLRARTGLLSVGLFGLRFGGFLAAQSAEAVSANFVILWSPITDSQQYCRSLLRMRLTAELIHLQSSEVKSTTQSMLAELRAGRSIDVLGNEYSPDLFHQMTSGAQWPVQAPAPNVLWLSRLPDRTVSEPLAQKWADSGRPIKFQSLPENPFWEELARVYPEKFVGASETWLAERYGRA